VCSVRYPLRSDRPEGVGGSQNRMCMDFLVWPPGAPRQGGRGGAVIIMIKNIIAIMMNIFKTTTNAFIIIIDNIIEFFCNDGEYNIIIGV